MHRVIAILLLFASSAIAAEGTLFDLFGRPVNPEHLNLAGAMPAGELKLVLDPHAPRFGAAKKTRATRKAFRTARASQGTPAQIIRLAPRPAQSVINVDQAVFATHLVKSGNRLMLRHY